MKELMYVREGDEYVLLEVEAESTPPSGAGQEILRCKSLAIGFDRVSGTLHKHGEHERVESWVSNARKKFRDAGFPEMADALVVLSGDLPLDEVNKCLAITGYCARMFEKLQANVGQGANPA